MLDFKHMFDWLYMDFEGQKSAEKLYQRIIVLFAAVGFVIGYYYQMFSYTVGSLAVGSLVATLICGIPWGYYRKHPLKWQPVLQTESASNVSASGAGTGHSEGKKKKNK